MLRAVGSTRDNIAVNLPLGEIDARHILYSIPRRIFGRCRFVYNLTQPGIVKLIKCPCAGYIPVTDRIVGVRLFG